MPTCLNKAYANAPGCKYLLQAKTRQSMLCIRGQEKNGVLREGEMQPLICLTVLLCFFGEFSFLDNKSHLIDFDLTVLELIQSNAQKGWKSLSFLFRKIKGISLQKQIICQSQSSSCTSYLGWQPLRQLNEAHLACDPSCC